jgi:pyridoxamine 5'-phosphate oxidase
VTKTEIIEFLNVNPTCYLATSEGNKPRVRALRMVRADEKGILIQTVEGKDLPKQLKDNPQVEICFYSAEKNGRTCGRWKPISLPKYMSNGETSSVARQIPDMSVSRS